MNNRIKILIWAMLEHIDSTFPAEQFLVDLQKIQGFLKRKRWERMAKLFPILFGDMLDIIEHTTTVDYFIVEFNEIMKEVKTKI